MGRQECSKSWIDYVPDLKRFYIRPGFEDWLAVNVRWYGAYAFAAHYGLSLPTEAEWEYAASGGRQFEWATGDGEISCDNADVLFLLAMQRCPASSDVLSSIAWFAAHRRPCVYRFVGCRQVRQAKNAS